jgi:hypothetical protein
VIILSQSYCKIYFLMILVGQSKKHLGSKFLVIQVDKDFCGFKIVIFQIFLVLIEHHQNNQNGCVYVENDRFKLENGYFLPKLAPMAQEWKSFITWFLAKKIGKKWQKMAKNGKKWQKNGKKMAKNGENGKKWRKMAKMAKMAENGENSNDIPLFLLGPNGINMTFS